ncbi:MAG: substrate-binding domain-containing protein [Magnetococcus sp. DMHC-6]
MFHFNSPLLAQTMENTGLMGGAAFSNPQDVVSKPQPWVEQPIAYDTWAKNTDVALILDQHLYPALQPLIETYAKQNQLNVAIREGTCGIASGMINRKQVDVGGFCCPPSAQDRLPGLSYHTLGIAALAIYVHPENPIDNLSLKQVRDIYSGRLTDWSQVESSSSAAPRPPLPIKQVTRLHCPTRPGHWSLILKNDQFSPSISDVGSIPDMFASVTGYQGAIGYETLWQMMKRHLQGQVKPIRIDGVSPSDTTAVAQKRFPFYRIYNITSWDLPGVRNQQAAQLVAYLKSHLDQIDPNFNIIPVSQLRQNGWIFQGDEVIGEPK